MSEQRPAFVFGYHRGLALVAFVVFVILLVLYQFTKTIPWDQTLVIAFLVYAIWRTVDVLLP